MMKQSLWRTLATVLVLVATISAFVWYFAAHKAVRDQLKQTSPSTLLILLTLYLLGIGSLAMVIKATMRLCKVQLKASESVLITAYSSVINFFGPLQSGPAFRALYVKAKYGLNLKHYAGASLVYYFFYGGLSGLLLLSGLLKWWLIPLIAASFAVTYTLCRTKWIAPRLRELDMRGWYYLAFATSLQVIVVTLIYYTELRSVAPGTTFAQAIVYSGAANLALFVSLTPGAIGFRESFLLFSQNLHHISPAAIVTANIIDRAMYIILLLILALFIFGSHANRRLKSISQ